MLRRSLAVAALFFASVVALAQPPAKPGGIAFRVKLDPALVGAKPESGRVLVGIAKGKQRPNFTNYRPPVLPVLGADADAFAADTVVALDNDSLTFPFVKLNDLPAGEYSVQAVFATNRDINLPNAPGNRYCDPVTVKLDPAAGTTVDLTLNKTYIERAPKETKTAKFLKLPSKLLSDFHGRPMEFRVGVVLPPNFDNEPDKKYASARRYRRLRHAVHLRRAHRPRTRGSCRSCPMGLGRSATRIRSIPRTTGLTVRH